MMIGIYLDLWGKVRAAGGGGGGNALKADFSVNTTESWFFY